MRNSILSALVFSVALVGCGGEPPPQTTVTEQANVLPTGAIQGRVTDAQTGAPIGGVAVKTLAGSAVSAASDPDGFYIINDVPAGSTYTLYFESEGYARGVANVALSGEVGDFPSGNAVATRNVVMARTDGRVKGFVFGAAGKPASGATVVADLRSVGFDVVASVQTTATGAFELSGLPGFPAGLDMTLAVPPYDENGDGSPEYDLTTASVRVFSGATSFRLISISPNGVGILSTNLADGDLGPAEPINITFTAPMNEGLTTATLRNTTRNLNLGITKSWENGIRLGIQPAGNTALAEADQYALTLNAVAVNGGTLSLTMPFTVRSSPVTQNNAVVAGVKLTSPSSFDWTTANYSLSWTADPDATGYKVYVRDVNKSPSYVQVASTVGSAPQPSASVTLPNAYDAFTGDSVFTPLAFGNKVTFAVISVDRYGNDGSLVTANTIEVGDNVSPNASTPLQVGNANNNTNAATTMQISVSFNEYMDVNTMPTLAITTGALVGAASTWTWNNDLRSGSFSLSIPANTDATGNFVISAAADSSGNPMEDISGLLRGATDLITNGSFEGCSLTGWTAYGNPAPAATSEAAFSGTCSARVGNDTVMTSQSAQSGTSVIAQSFTVPFGVSNIVATVRYRPFSINDSSQHDSKTCRITTGGGSTLYTLFTDSTNDTNFRLATVNISSGYAGSTLQIMCSASQDGFHTTGMWVDEVSVTAN